MSIHTLLRYVISSLLLQIFTASALAYDFSASTSTGALIYYNVLPGSAVEVTYDTRFKPTPSYRNKIEIPSKVVFDGQEYTVTRIGERAFFDCRELNGLVIPSTVAEIGRWAFAWCDALANVSLPNALTSVSADAFDGCYALAKIDLSGESFSSIDGVVFSNDRSKLVVFPPAYEGSYDVPATTTEISDRAFGGCAFVSEVTLPKEMHKIGKHAFYYCNWLRKINVPSTVTSIGDGAFGDCASLSDINVSESNSSFSSHRGILYDKDFTTLIQCPGGASDDADIPATVKTIGKQAFFRNLGMPTIALPEGVATICEGSFLDSQSLAALQMPSTVKKIESMAVAMCPSLTAVYADMPDPSLVELGDEVFAETDLDKCVLYVPMGSSMKYRNAPQWNAFRQIYEVDGLKEQSISWLGQTDSIDFNTQSVRLEAVASSGLPVKYTISPKSEGFGYISGDTLVVIHPGEISVTAFQTGNNSFYPAPPVTYVFRSNQSGIQSPETDNVKVYGSIGRIIIKGSEANNLVRIFSVSGVLIYSGYDADVPVDARGIYIVAVRGRSYKVAVR